MKMVAKVLVYNNNNQILVLRRSVTHPHFAFHLDLPGGVVEDGESVEEASSREITEETGLHVDPVLLKVVSEETIPIGTKHLLLAVTLDQPSPDIQISWEHDKYMWMSEADIVDSDTPEGMDLFFAFALEYLKGKK